MNRLFQCLCVGLLVLPSLAMAVDCTPNDITLASQAEVDGFQANHGPGCDNIVTSLTITGASINDLAPLAGLKTMGFGTIFGTRLVISDTSIASLSGLGLTSIHRFELNNNASLTSIAAISSVTSLGGPVFINGNASLGNLNGLENVGSLQYGALFIENNTSLSDLSGVSNITSINAALVIGNNDALANLDDFAGLQHVSSNISISNNDALTDISALAGLVGFNETLNISRNSQLASLGNLTNLTDLSGLVISVNDLLTDLDGLENLATIGDGSGLVITHNNSLANIDALSGLVSDEWLVEVRNNAQLTGCSALKTLLDSVDDALPGPGPNPDGIPDVLGDVTIEDNGTGCNSVEDIVGAGPPPATGTSFHYSGLVPGRLQLLLKGFNITRSCLGSHVPLPNGGRVLASRVLYACAPISYEDSDTLVYDVAEDTCRKYEDFASTTSLDIHAAYFAQSDTGAPLEQLEDVSFSYDQHALLIFDPHTGDLQRGESMVCAEGEGTPPPPTPDELGQLAYLKADNAGVDDNFGDKVAISGDTVVVGAKVEDGSSTTIDGVDDNLAASAGAAYVYVKDSVTGNWVQQAYLKASNGEGGDKFGADVAIDGDTLVVGAENENGEGNAMGNSGAAYVFVRNGATWSEQAILRPSNAATGDWFGGDVAISGDTIVVGAYKENEAFVFTRSGTSWTEQQILTGSNTESGDSFGRGVAIDGDTVVVGAFAEDSDSTGVNGPEDNNNTPTSGAAYVFTRSGDTWTQQAYLKASNPDQADLFGGALSISGDTIAVGVYHESSNATGIDGEQGNNSLLDSGAAYIFVRNAGVWSQQAYIKASNTGYQDNFGAAISISGDLMVAGAAREDSNGVDGELDQSSTDSGAVYAFVRDGTSWSQLAYLKASNNDPGDWIGRDAGISGSTIVAGALFEDASASGGEADNSTGNSGAAYIFDDTGGGGPGPGDTTPPVVTPPADIVSIEATGPYTPVVLGDATVTDNSGESLTATPGFAGPFLIGDTTVTWSATDSAGNTGTGEQVVGLVDTTDPVVIAPADITRVANGPLSMVFPGYATASDIAGPLQSLVNNAPDGFPVGVTVVTWTATDSSGNSAMDTQSVTITPPEIEAPWAGSLPRIDGFLDYKEWEDATRFNLENGFIAFMHASDRLYVLVDVLVDDVDDPFHNGGGDQFWLHFDIDEDGAITPDVDLRYRLESGTGNLRLQTSCDGCPGDFNPLEAQTFSARGEGFGCFFEDKSLSFIPLRCRNHRVWELALDLAELEMRTDRSTRFGYLVASGSPLLSENYPADLNDLADYISLTLARTVRLKAGTGPGAMSPMFEVTQGVQTTTNSIDLVAGKRTAVRIWDASNESRVMNFIFGARNGVDLPGSPLLDVSDLYDNSFGPDNPRDTIAWNSMTTLPDDWSEGGLVDFDVVIQGLDDSTVASLGANIDFVHTRTPVFWTVPVRNNFPDFAFTLAPGAQITTAEQRLQSTAPISNIDFVRRPIISVNNVTTSAGLKQVLKTYDQMVIMAWNAGVAANGVAPFDMPEQITGFNTTGFGTVGGSSDRVGKGGDGRITWVSLSGRMMTYAHEINHNVDRAMTSTWGLHSRGCNASSGGPLDPSWPYGNSWRIQETGVFATMNGGFTSVNDQTPDLMSYCSATSTPTTWWSPYRWQAWVDEFRNPAPTAGALKAEQPRDSLQASSKQAGLPATEDSFYVLGRVYPDDSGEFAQVLRQPGVPDPEGMTGDYSVRVLDCGDVTLAENSFPVDFLGDEGEDDEFVSFGFVLPAPAQSCSIELLLNAVVLDSRVISANAPTVTITTPNGGEHWDGVESVEWTADDLDSDPLLFTLLYSADDGMSWRVVDTMIDAMEYELDSTSLPGSDAALVRVLATDGGNTGQDDSDASFTVAGKALEVEILSPVHGDSFPSSQPINLVGVARDTHGDPWPEEDLLWSTTGGIAGVGSSISINLDEGIHPVSLIAMDGLAIARVEVVEITVSDEPGEISFDSSLYEVNEKDGLVILRVVRTGAAVGPAMVLYSTQDGVAVSGGNPAIGENDYESVAEDPLHRLEWGDGEAGERFFSVIINEDGAAEAPEGFKVLIKAVSGETLGISSASVLITSDFPDTLFSDSFED